MATSPEQQANQAAEQAYWRSDVPLTNKEIRFLRLLILREIKTLDQGERSRRGFLEAFNITSEDVATDTIFDSTWKPHKPARGKKTTTREEEKKK